MPSLSVELASSSCSIMPILGHLKTASHLLLARSGLERLFNMFTFSIVDFSLAEFGSSILLLRGLVLGVCIFCILSLLACLG
jgi:hypothetical protein